jgi:flagellar motor switch protein FliN/FliY
VSATVSPFPFSSLEAMSRAEADAAARLRRVARAYVRVDALAGALSDLTGERVEILVRKIRRADGRAQDDAVGVMLAAPEDRSPGRRALVDLEGALAAALVARALERRAPRITDPARAASPSVAGATAAVVAAAVRRSHAGAPLRVIAAGPANALARDLASTHPDATTAWLTILVGADAYEARVTVPDAAALAPVPSAPDLRAALRAMGDAALALPLVVATALAARREIEALATGDAFVPGSFALALGRGGALHGRVALVAPAAEKGLGADLAEDGRLVVRDLVESHPLSPREDPMEASTRSTDTVEVLEDVPVVVRVELGTVEMKAREWADLSAGDVVTLGRKLGDHAVLRVGGVEVARGELVVVDGEYAVRIVARAGDPSK